MLKGKGAMKLLVFRTYFFVLLERGLLGRREAKKDAENTDN